MSSKYEGEVMEAHIKTLSGLISLQIHDVYVNQIFE